MAKKSKTPKNKNVRLSFDAWKALRTLKFDTGMTSYTEVFEMVFEALDKGKTDVNALILNKKPTETEADPSKSDKTIVIDESIHVKLATYKQKYMIENDATARGPGAASISQIVTTLIEKYREMKS